MQDIFEQRESAMEEIIKEEKARAEAEAKVAAESRTQNGTERSYSTAEDEGLSSSLRGVHFDGDVAATKADGEDLEEQEPTTEHNDEEDKSLFTINEKEKDWRHVEIGHLVQNIIWRI